MDPKHLNNLDPKLKEVYERVMGTNVNISQPTPAAQPQAPTSQPNTPNTAHPVMMTQELHTEYKPQVFTAEHHKEKHEEKKHETTAPGVKKKSSSAASLILTICGILFFVAYTIFWMRLFNLTVPFLPF